jgi:hypothetical protein
MSHENCDFCDFLKIWLRCGMAVFSLLFVVGLVTDLFSAVWLRAAVALLAAATCALVSWHAPWLVDKFNDGFDWLFTCIFGHH